MNFATTRRLWQIHRVVRKYGLMEFLPDRVPTRPEPRGERLRMALEELGPVFVKLGQALSTRPDLLPEDIAAELTRLQDKVPPFDPETSRRIVEKALERTVVEAFASFELDPIASDSVAQQHNATLHDGSESFSGRHAVRRIAIRRLIREQLVKDGAQRIDVGAKVDILNTSHSLFRRHICGRAYDCSIHRQQRRF